MAVGRWPLAVGRWPLAVGRWRKEHTASPMVNRGVTNSAREQPGALIRPSDVRYRAGAPGVEKRPPPPRAGGAKEETMAMEGLTERERDVLRLLALQLSNEEIAETLCISQRTAETHVAHVVAKLGVANRREAGRLALGLFDERKDQ